MSGIHLQKSIPSSLNGYRLDKALASLLPEYSRAQIQQWIVANQVTVDGQRLRPKDKVITDQRIDIMAEPITQSEWIPQNIAIDIRYEDDHCMVINKPAGLIVHPGAGNRDMTLANALLHHAPTLADVPRAGIVHRLDKDTTGLLVIAKTLIAHNALTKAMQAREIHRTYEAIVVGEFISGGTIDAPIGRHPKKRTLMAIKRDGREAITHYRIIKKFPHHTHLKVQLETGRTHQIRVHFQHINHSLVGDPAYGRHLKIRGMDPEVQSQILNFPRQALHATELDLPHPVEEKRIVVHAELPKDFQTLLALLDS